jgi:hypothetical protein
MTDRQYAKLKMYQKVLEVCDEHKNVYAGVPTIVTAVSLLKEQTSEILVVAKQQTATRPQGATKDKGEAIDRLVVLSLKVANPLYALAFDTGDNRLLDKINVNKSRFYNVHDQETLKLAKIIADEANAKGEALVNYGISNADRTELNEAIAQLEKLMQAPAVVVGERKNYTSILRQLFVASDSLIYDKLDKLMIPFKTSSPEFYNLYSNARNVINTAVRKRKTEEGKQ